MVLSDRTIARLIGEGRIGIDPYDPVLDCMVSWLDARGLECRRRSYSYFGISPASGSPPTAGPGTAQK